MHLRPLGSRFQINYRSTKYEWALARRQSIFRNKHISILPSYCHLQISIQDFLRWTYQYNKTKQNKIQQVQYLFYLHRVSFP